MSIATNELFRSALGDTDLEGREEAILVIDQVGSTERMIALGEQVSCQENGRMLRLLSKVALRHGGQVINYTGDGAILRFLDPDLAVATAGSVMSHCNDIGHPEAAEKVCLRAGMHIGRLMNVGAHAFGVALVTAVRLCDEAAPGELLLSADALDRCRNSITVGSLSSLCLKGLAGTTEAHSVSGCSLGGCPGGADLL